MIRTFVLGLVCVFAGTVASAAIDIKEVTSDGGVEA